jgi:hypothetical protein
MMQLLMTIGYEQMMEEVSCPADREELYNSRRHEKPTLWGGHRQVVTLHSM